MKKTPKPDLMTAASAGRILGVSPRRVRALQQAGLLDAVPVHARLQLYTRQSVERYASQRRPAGRPPHSQE